MQTVADVDPDRPQWAGPEIGLSEFKPGTEVSVNAVATWAGNDTVALTVMLESATGFHLPLNQGKVLLVDTTQRSVRVLAERGSVVAVFPDGALLLRTDWIGGEIQLLRPGLNAQQNQSHIVVAPSGPWTTGWSLSPDGKQVAWLEMDPPPGDWSRRLPYNCCSGDPSPTVRGIAVWERAAGKIRRVETSVSPRSAPTFPGPSMIG